MRLVKIMERGGEEYHDYKKALRKAKESIDILCELTEDMEDQYGSRGNYSNRYGSRGSYRRDEKDWDEMSERRM